MDCFDSYNYKDYCNVRPIVELQGFKISDVLHFNFDT